MSGKTEFPASWSDEEILHNISDVATDPRAFYGIDDMGSWYQPYTVGTRNNIQIRVDFYPENSIHSGKISSGYPINTPKNP